MQKKHFHYILECHHRIEIHWMFFSTSTSSLIFRHISLQWQKTFGSDSPTAALRTLWKRSVVRIPSEITSGLRKYPTKDCECKISHEDCKFWFRFAKGGYAWVIREQPSETEHAYALLKKYDGFNLGKKALWIWNSFIFK